MVRQLRLLRVRRNHPQNHHRRRRHCHYHNPSCAAIPCDPRLGFGLDIESRRYCSFLFSLIVNRPFFCRRKKIKNTVPTIVLCKMDPKHKRDIYISVAGTLFETHTPPLALELPLIQLGTYARAHTHARTRARRFCSVAHTHALTIATSRANSHNRQL
jgi:hypothetical protein